MNYSLEAGHAHLIDWKEPKRVALGEAKDGGLQRGNETLALKRRPILHISHPQIR